MRAAYALGCALLALTPSLGMARSAAVGDSLAQGFGWASHFEVYATRSKSSCWIAEHLPSGHFDFMLISAGTNDPPGNCIEQIRTQVQADVVEWVVPVAPSARAHVISVAHTHGDRLFFYTPSRRKAVWPHPDFYRRVKLP